MNRRTTIATIAVLLGAAACGEDSSVGSGVDLNLKEQAQEMRLGETTTTTAAAEEQAAPQRAAVGDTTTTAPPPTTAPPTTAPPQQEEQVALAIAINDDGSNTTQFQPSLGRVYAGTIVEWVNQDSVPRSVVFNDGSFDSGMIPPGGRVRYIPPSPGEFGYTDGTRPYAVGRLEVISR